MMSLLVNAKSVIAVILAAVVIGAGVYIKGLRSSLSDVQIELRDAQLNVQTFKMSAEQAVQDAEALIRSRDAAASSYRDAIDKISAAQGQCLDTKIPIEWMD